MSIIPPFVFAAEIKTRVFGSIDVLLTYVCRKIKHIYLHLK